MIIKIDHIAVSSLHLDEHIDIFSRLGYSLMFQEMGVKNLGIKRSLMGSFVESHDLAFMTSPSNLSLEFVNYGHIYSSYSCIYPIFQSMPAVFCSKVDGERTVIGTASRLKIKDLDIPMYVEQGDEGNGLKFTKLIIKTIDLNDSLLLWGSLGFVMKERITDNFIKLEFKELVGNNVFSLYLERAYSQKTPFVLDAKGFTCMALVSSSAYKEREYLCRQGVDVTDIASVKVNGRELDVFFALRSRGEAVEIISVKA